MSRRRVFPTPVGVFLKEALPLPMAWGLPHARGGVSGPQYLGGRGGVSSPRPWGCFPGRHCAHPGRNVFPTPVGVFPTACVQSISTTGLPHARGGVSEDALMSETPEKSSPRPWGCFWLEAYLKAHCKVFPTPVGVFLLKPHHLPTVYGLPHARGGVSDENAKYYSDSGSSPRPWGCFIV